MAFLFAGPNGSGGNSGALVPSSALGLVSSSHIDQTSKIQTAIATTASDGVGIYWVPGIYCYSGPITNLVPWVGANNQQVELRNTNSSGGGAVINNSTSTVPLTFSGISFTSPNTPLNSVNNAVSVDYVLFFSSNINPNVDSCLFSKSFGVCVVYQHVTGGIISNNKVFTCYKDAFHIEGTSNNCVRFNNLVEDGGDDAFAVVGSLGGSAPGQPKNIIDINNRVRGVKFSRAFAYIGSQGVQNIGCSVDGQIPDAYARSTSQQSCCAMLIYSDSVFNTYGNSDLAVSTFKAKNCGRPNNYPAVQIGVDTTGTVNNFRITDMSIKNSANTGFYVQGGTAGGIDGLYVSGLDIDDTSDPNGYAGTPGTLTKNGFELHNANNVFMSGSMQDTGGDGGFVDANCGGEIDLDFKTYRINKGGKTGSCRILSLPTSAPTIDRLRAKLFVAEQATVTVSGSPYFISQSVIATGCAGAIESIEVEYARTVGAVNGVSLPGANTAVSITASPFTYTNSTSAKQIMNLTPGTSTGVSVQRGQSSTPGATGRTAGIFTLSPGESLIITYSSLGSMTLTSHVSEGI